MCLNYYKGLPAFHLRKHRCGVSTISDYLASIDIDLLPISKNTRIVDITTGILHTMTAIIFLYNMKFPESDNFVFIIINFAYHTARTTHGDGYVSMYLRNCYYCVIIVLYCCETTETRVIVFHYYFL